MALVTGDGSVTVDAYNKAWKEIGEVSKTSSARRRNNHATREAVSDIFRCHYHYIYCCHWCCCCCFWGDLILPLDSAREGFANINNFVVQNGRPNMRQKENESIYVMEVELMLLGRHEYGIRMMCLAHKFHPFTIKFKQNILHTWNGCEIIYFVGGENLQTNDKKIRTARTFSLHTTYYSRQWRW